MDTATELLIRITPRSNTIQTEFVQKGVRRCKQVSYDTLVESIRGSLEKNLVSSGLLPTGCISVQAGASGRFITSILHPELRADISYAGTEYQGFPLPRLVFKFEHQDGARVMRSWMGVVGQGLLTPKTPMYHYPFSNVSGYRLCTGNNPMPVCKSLHTLGSLPYYILAMPNNNDHFNKRHNKPQLEMRDLLELLKDKNPNFYYSDILIPDSRTLMDFINEN